MKNPGELYSTMARTTAPKIGQKEDDGRGVSATREPKVVGLNPAELCRLALGLVEVGPLHDVR
jgi:hypothetical protein